MNYAIVGFGTVGQALARAFARKNIEVIVAGRRSAAALTPEAKAIGPTVIPRSLKETLAVEIVILAVPFGAQVELAKVTSWTGKTVVDVSNAYGVDPENLGNRPSSVAVAEALKGCRLVKAFNHLPAPKLAEDPSVKLAAARSSCPATTPKPPPESDLWSKNWDSRPLSSGDSRRGACSSKPKDPPGHR